MAEHTLLMSASEGNARGIKQANKHLMIATLTYNLKKYLRFISRKAGANLRALEQSALKPMKNGTQTLFSVLGCIIMNYRKPVFKFYSPW